MQNSTGRGRGRGGSIRTTINRACKNNASSNATPQTETTPTVNANDESANYFSGESSSQESSIFGSHTPLPKLSPFGQLNEKEREYLFSTPLKQATEPTLFGASVNNRERREQNRLDALNALSIFGSTQCFSFGFRDNYFNRPEKSIVSNLEEYCNNVNPCKVNVIVDNNNGNLALHYAIMFHNNQCIDILLQKGADARLKNKNDENAYDYAIKHNNSYFFYKVRERNVEKFNLLNGHVDNLKKQIVDLDVKNNNLNAVVKDMEQRESLLKIQIDELKGKTSRYETIISQLNDNNKSLLNDNQQISLSNASLKKNNDDNLKSLSDLMNDHDSILTENNNRKRIIEELTNDVTTLLAKNSEDVKTIAQLKDDNEELIKNNDELKRKIDHLEESYDGLLSQQSKKRRINQ